MDPRRVGSDAAIVTSSFFGRLFSFASCFLICLVLFLLPLARYFASSFSRFLCSVFLALCSFFSFQVLRLLLDLILYIDALIASYRGIRGIDDSSTVRV